MTDKSAKYIADGSPNLTALGMSSTQVTNFSVACLVSMTSLIELKLEECHEINDQCLSIFENVNSNYYRGTGFIGNWTGQTELHQQLTYHTLY